MEVEHKPVWIELVNTGVGARYELEDSELIEVNWRLVNYPELYFKVLKHEIGHEDGKMTLKDFGHDMSSRTPGLFKFMKKHISSWTILLPIYYSKRHKTMIYDWNTIISWFILFGMAGGIYYSLNIIMSWIGAIW